MHDLRGGPWFLSMPKLFSLQDVENAQQEQAATRELMIRLRILYFIEETEDGLAAHIPDRTDSASLCF